MDGTGTATYLFGESLPLTAGAENINNTFKYLTIYLVNGASCKTLFRVDFLKT
jgi:hypothetical protein